MKGIRDVTQQFFKGCMSDDSTVIGLPWTFCKMVHLFRGMSMEAMVHNLPWLSMEDGVRILHGNGSGIHGIPWMHLRDREFMISW